MSLLNKGGYYVLWYYKFIIILTSKSSFKCWSQTVKSYSFDNLSHSCYDAVLKFMKVHFPFNYSIIIQFQASLRLLGKLLFSA